MPEASGSSRQELLPAREAVVADLVRGVLAGTPTASVITGEAGLGGSAVLDAVARDLAQEQVQVLRLRVGQDDRQTPYGALYRLLIELEQNSTGRPRASERNTVLGLVAKLSADAAPGDVPDEETAARLATSVFTALRRFAPAVLLVDDAHRLDTATARLVEQFVRRCAGGGCSIIATWRTAGPGDLDAYGHARSLLRLFTAGVVRAVTLRPLTRAETTALISREIAAVPDRALVERFHERTRGNLSALRAAIEDARASGSLRIVDQHAYLGPGVEPLSLPEDHPLLAYLRELSPLRRQVVAAMAVLCPVSGGLLELVAEALDVDADTVAAELEALVRYRVLVRDPSGGWRFRKPVVREGMQTLLGPYERRRLCAHGATALWEGRAHTDDDTLLPDLLVGAGGLVDQERSAKELLSRGGQLMYADNARAVRCLRAAAARTLDERERADAMVVYASACGLGDQMSEAVESSRELLRRFSAELTPDMLQMMEIVCVTALAACARWEELEQLADWTYTPWPARRPGHEVITRAFSLVLLGRWVEGERLLQQWREVWSTANPATAYFGHIVLSGAGVLLGDPSTVRRVTTEPGSLPPGELPQFAFERCRHEVDMLLVLGELELARQRLEASSMGADQLHGPDRFLVQWLTGDHATALESARCSMAEGNSSARMLASVLMFSGSARLLAGQGWLSRARRMLESNRSSPQLAHLLDHAEATVARFLGEDDEADALLRRGLEYAEDAGFVLGTEAMWAELASRERALGELARARECLARAEELAKQLGTGHAELMWLLARAEVCDEQQAARDAVALARQRDIPHECADVFRRAALCGVDTARLLRESYELYGRIDALLWRGQMRMVMRAREVTVPGRSTATRENERLLAVLVSEGLSNRQMATVLGSSEKSVEGRLTRMFAKVGYRSRVELTAALLRGEFQT